MPPADGPQDLASYGFRQSKLLSQLLAGQSLDVRTSVRTVPVIPDTAEALDALAVLRNAEVPMALVHDEYGHFEGVVTPADVLEAIAGAFRADADTDEPGMVQREDGSWLLAGWLPVDEIAEHLALRLPSERDYHTLAGYILDVLGRLPAVGEHIVIGGWRFEVVDLDGKRIDKLIAVPSQPIETPTTGLHRMVPPPRQ